MVWLFFSKVVWQPCSETVTADSSKPNSFILCAKKQGHRRAGNDGGIPPFSFKREATGAEVTFHHSIMGNFMVYQDRIETSLLQLPLFRRL